MDLLNRVLHNCVYLGLQNHAWNEIYAYVARRGRWIPNDGRRCAINSRSNSVNENILYLSVWKASKPFLRPRIHKKRGKLLRVRPPSWTVCVLNSVQLFDKSMAHWSFCPFDTRLQ